MSRYEFSLQGLDASSRHVIAEIRILGDRPMCPSLVVTELKALSLTVALEASDDGANWTRVREWSMNSIGWSRYPPGVFEGPRLRAVAWTLLGRSAVGSFELVEVRDKSAS